MNNKTSHFPTIIGIIMIIVGIVGIGEAIEKSNKNKKPYLTNDQSIEEVTKCTNAGLKAYKIQDYNFRGNLRGMKAVICQ